MMERRRFTAALLATAGLAATGLALPRAARAQAQPDGWPARPVRVIYPTGPGGPSDNFRLYADHLKAVFGQSFVGENMAGGSGAIGATAVARAECRSRSHRHEHGTVRGRPRATSPRCRTS
jgi:tripartite-type tricarboxylate transporter receptor subunit TctC